MLCHEATEMAMGEGVRVATEGDAEAVAAIYAPYVRETAISFEAEAPSPAEMRRRIRQTLATHPFLVFETDGQVVGYAYASRHRERAAYLWSVDTTVYVAPAAHRRGVGRALYGRLFDILPRQGFHRAHAGITLPNEKSVGLHSAMGFQHIGTYREVGFKLGAWRDVSWWGLDLGAAAAAEPIPFATFAVQSPA
jgi:L-amino acid N-acyltransferase YncA